MEASPLTDYEEAVKQAGKARKLTASFIKKQFGPRCEDFEAECSVCQRWSAFDTLFDLSMYEPGPEGEANPFRGVLSDDEYISLRGRFPDLNRPDHIVTTGMVKARGYLFCHGVSLYMKNNGWYSTEQFPGASFKLSDFHGVYKVYDPKF